MKEKEKNLKEKDELKTAFLKNVSHEFRTPVNGIIGFSKLLIKDDLTEDEKESYGEIIMESCDRLLNLVTDTVDIAQIQNNEIELNETNCNIKSILEKSYSKNKWKAQKRDVKFNIEIGTKEELIVYNDEEKLFRAINHIVENAVKFTNKGTISIIAQKKERNVLISIKDTGIGIPREKQRIILEPYHQGDNNITRKYGGSGIGLSIANYFLGLTGGSLTLNSEENKGTEVIINIPVVRENINENKKNQEENSLNILKGLNVLIAEDEEINYKYLKTTLEKHVNSISYAYTGKEAIELMKSRPLPDIILMDLKMPEIDGFEATKEIKKSFPYIPVIAETAYATKLEKEKAIKSGCDEIIVKPVERDELLEKMISLVNRKKPNN